MTYDGGSSTSLSASRGALSKSSPSLGHGAPFIYRCKVVNPIATWMIQTIDNTGHRFYGCRNYESGDYRLFAWIDVSFILKGQKICYA